MSNFSRRSQEKELMDLGSEYYTSKEYTQCLRKLFYINKLLGFFHATQKILKKIHPKLSLLDVGCGGGDFILHLSHLFPEMTMIGTDIEPSAIQHAKNTLKKWKEWKPETRVSFQLHEDSIFNADIILLTLVCHHLEDKDLVNFLKNIYQAANVAVIINDLHRHRLAYILYAIVSPFFRNRLIQHDGLISIRRGFIRREWKFLLSQANIQKFQLKWCFPFRWQLILWK